MKIAFVGQMHYFDCAIPFDMKGTEIKRFNVNGAFNEPERADPILEFKDDIDVWFFLRGEFISDKHLRQLSGKKVWISTEPIQRAETMYCMDQGKNRFDAHYHYDKTHLAELRKRGFKLNGDFQLPVNLQLYQDLNHDKKWWDVGFIGRSTDKRERHFDLVTPRREAYMGVLKHNFWFLHVSHGLTGDLLVDILNRIKIHLNLHIDTYPQLQHRMQNIIACNQFVISDPLSHNDDLQKHLHYVPFTNATDLYEKVKYYLDHEEERKQIAAAGYEYVKKRFDAKQCWQQLIKEVSQ